MTGFMVVSFANIEEYIGIIFQNSQSISRGDVVHSNIIFECFGPCFEAAFQSVNFGHIVAQSGESVGGSLSVGFTGVADDYDIFVQTAGSQLHGSNAVSKVTFFCSIHIVSSSARNGSSGGVSSFTNVEEYVIFITQNFSSISNRDVLHSYVSFRSFDVICDQNFFVCFVPSSETAFQSINFGHIVAQSGQYVGGSLSVAFTGVAYDNQIFVQIFGCILHYFNACFKVAFFCSVHVVSQSARNGSFCGVSSFAYVEEYVRIIVQNFLSIVNGDVLHCYVGSRSFDFSRSFFRSRSCFAGFGPSGEAAFQSVNFGHIVAQSRQHVGGSLSVAFAGVANQNDVFVQIFDCRGHGSNACFKVAFFCSIHVVSQSARDGSSRGVSSFTNVEEHVAVVIQQSFCFVNGFVLHSNIGSRSFYFVFCRWGSGSLFLSAAGHHSENHQRAHQSSKNSFHGKPP